MNSIQSIPRKLALAIFAFVALFNTSFGASIGDMNKDALAAMKSGKWAEAQAVLVKATNAYDSRAPSFMGHALVGFGIIEATAKSNSACSETQ